MAAHALTASSAGGQTLTTRPSRAAHSAAPPSAARSAYAPGEDADSARPCAATNRRRAALRCSAASGRDRWAGGRMSGNGLERRDLAGGLPHDRGRRVTDAFLTRRARRGERGRRVVLGLFFFPRGGSAQVARALSRALGRAFFPGGSRGPRGADGVLLSCSRPDVAHSRATRLAVWSPDSAVAVAVT